MRRYFSDLRDAARSLARDHRDAPAVVASVAIAVGASALVFGFVEALLLRSPGVRDRASLVVMWEEDLDRDRHLFEVSFPNFTTWRSQSRSFTDMAAMGSHDWGFVFLGGKGPEEIPYRAVSASFFDTLGARPLLGRTFRASDDEPASERVLVLSHGLWQRRYSGNPGIVGRVVSVETARGATPFTVVGVMPEEFRFPSGSQAWSPAGREMADVQSIQGLSDETMGWLGVFHVVGRLEPGVTFEGAEAEMDVIAGRIAASIDRRHGVAVTPFSDFVSGRTRPAMIALSAAAGLLILIACGNVANLLLFRSLARRPAFAVRRVLGASRAGIARLVLFESLFLSLGGAALGLLLARVAIDPVARIAPPGIPELSRASIDGSVAAFAVLLAAVAAALASLLPISRSEDSLRPRHPASGGLVVAEMALAVVVLVAAALAGKSFLRLTRADLGFDPRGVVSFGASPSSARYPDGASRKAFYTELLERVRGVPRVEAAGAILVRPYQLGVIGQDGWILAEGQPEETSRENPIVNWQVASPGYFRAMGIPLENGRAFEPMDDERAAPVAVVGESLARRLWPGQDPLGRRFRTLGFAPAGDGEPPWVTVVGVAQDVRYRELDRARPNLYLDYRQVDPVPDGLTVVVRARGDTSSLAGPLAAEVQAIDPHEPIDGLAAMDDVVWEAQAPWRFASVLFSALALSSSGLAGLGIFSVLSRSVSERKKELALRMAMGARRYHVLRLTAGRAVTWTLLGVGIGLALAIPFARMTRSLLFEVDPKDPVILAAVLPAIVVLALLGSWVPARRAASIDPAEPLRSQ